MKQYFTSQFKLDKSPMEDRFDEYKQWLKHNKRYDKDIHIGTEWSRTFLGEPYMNELIANAIKKEEDNMSRIEYNKFFTNKPDIKVLYNGFTYDVHEFEMTQDAMYIEPTIRVTFQPSIRNILKTPADNRCTKCPPNDFSIDKVIFNGPATIVHWKDGTKTVVKCENEDNDPEKGLAMAIVKKVFGNKGNYYNTVRKALDNAEYYNQPVEPKFDIADLIIANLLGGHRKQEDDGNE